MNDLDVLIETVIRMLGGVGGMVLALVLVVWAVLWTLLPIYVVMIYGRMKKLEAAMEADAIQRASMMRAQTMHLGKMVDALEGARVETQDG